VTMPAAGEWFITPHAIEKYRERFAPYLTYEEALEDLIEQSRKAHYVKTYDHHPNSIRGGLELWRGPRPRRLRYWVGLDNDGKPQLVTVIGEHDRWRYGDGRDP